jgi:hypothetical protein
VAATPSPTPGTTVHAIASPNTAADGSPVDARLAAACLLVLGGAVVLMRRRERRAR